MNLNPCKEEEFYAILYQNFLEDFFKEMKRWPTIYEAQEWVDRLPKKQKGD